MSPAAAPTPPVPPAPPSPPLQAEELLALHALFSEYAAVCDSGDFGRWPELFTEDGVYRLQSRENHERGLPLATLAFQGRAMLRDRVYGAAETIFHDPYYQRHIAGLPRLLARESDGALHTESNVLVVRTHRDRLPELLLAGRCLDRVVCTPEGWRFAERLVIFDNDLIANSIIYPV